MTVIEQSPLTEPIETKWARLGDVADINPKWNPLASKDDPVSFVGMAQMSDELGCVTGEEQRLVQEVRTGYTVFEQGDLLVAKITPCFENGKIGHANITNKWGAGSTEFHVVRPGDRLDPDYALHFLRRQEFRTSGKLRMTGSGGQQRVPASYVSDTKIPFPPLPEQRRIAAILDKADHLRTQRREALAHLDALTQSIFNSMFGGENVVALGSVATFRYGSSNKSAATGTVCLRIPNVARGAIDWDDLKRVPVTSAELDRLKLEADDLLFVRSNGNPDFVGRSAVFTVQRDEPTIYASYLIRARLNGTLLTSTYVHAFLETKRGRRHLRAGARTSAGQFNINTQALSALPIPVPAIELQQAFASRLAGIERLKEQHRTQLAELDALFASLQHRAFRGEL